MKNWVVLFLILSSQYLLGQISHKSNNIQSDIYSYPTIFLDYNFKGKIPIFENIDKNKVLDSLQNDSLTDDMIYFKVDTCIGEMILVEPYYIFGYKDLPKGWIVLSEQITVLLVPTYGRFSDERFVRVYEMPSIESSFECVEDTYDPVTFIAYYCNWTHIKFYSKIKKKL